MTRQFRLILFLLGTGVFLYFLAALLTSDEGELLWERDLITFDNALYTPEELPDLSEGSPEGEHIYWSNQPFSRVRTSVAEIELEEGRVYGLYSENLTYAARIWINGELFVDQGHVSETPEDFRPKTGSVLVYFTAEKNNQIVVQRANFNHELWNLFLIYLAPQEVITRSVQTSWLKNAALLIFLLTVGFLNLGMFATLPARRHFLWFSLSCLFMAVNFAFGDPKLIMLPFPELNWYVGHKIESIAMILAGVFLIQFFWECFGSPGRWVRRIWYLLAGFALCWYLFLPSRLYTRYAVLVTNAVILYAGAVCVELIVRSLRRRKTLTVSQHYYLAGIAVVAVGGLLAAFRVGPYIAFWQIALILFETVLTIGVATEFQNIQQAYEQSAQRENELRRMNEAMERAQELQENFMAIMNHEMRTPLTVIAGYADKVSTQVKDESALRALVLIKQEALRLGRIVEQSEDGMVSPLSTLRSETIDMEELLKDVRAFCSPICEKRKNTLVLQCQPGLNVQGIRDSLLQAFYNLIINASRHTQNGRILVSAEQAGQEILLSVRDSGEGMDEETMAHAFEKGYTRDGGHGIGLALCREIAEFHGGRIGIRRNDPEKGITVFLALPQEKPE